jgi:hypothetical protein
MLLKNLQDKHGYGTVIAKEIKPGFVTGSGCRSKK